MGDMALRAGTENKERQKAHGDSDEQTHCRLHVSNFFIFLKGHWVDFCFSH